jgi:3-dehydroquinate dehydratase-2
MHNNRIQVMHGVNLDQLGRRDPAHYGTLNLSQLERRIDEFASELGMDTRFLQTNAEHEFVEALHQASDVVDGVLINAGAWTHYSYAIHDAIEVAGVPAVEVHLSDIANREEWRRHSVLTPACVGVVSGKGPDGYREALELLRSAIRK